MEIIDFHSHILPAIDDGSKNLDTSLWMLEQFREHGVGTVVATPHFYADRDRVDDFLDRRNRAYHEVKDNYNQMLPKLKLAAEVAFFNGISRADRMKELTIEGTDTLMLEMPFTAWDEEVYKEVCRLIDKMGLNIVIVHLERFIKYPDNKKWIEKILALEHIKVQINAEALTDWRMRGSVIKLFKSGKAHLLGSDCHGMHHRVPNLWEGREVIKKKLGDNYLKQIDENGNKLLKNVLD